VEESTNDREKIIEDWEDFFGESSVNVEKESINVEKEPINVEKESISVEKDSIKNVKQTDSKNNYLNCTFNITNFYN
jgi:uncharacterized membrane protein